MLTSQFVEWRSLNLNVGGKTANQSLELERPLHLLVLDNEEGFVCSGSKFTALSHANLALCGSVSQPLVVDMEPLVTTQAVITAIESLKSLGFTQVGLGALR